jgi:hypothetical protein
MAIKWDGFLRIAARVLGALVKALTPEIREMIEKNVKEWEAKAAETPNALDDLFVDALKNVLEIE